MTLEQLYARVLELEGKVAALEGTAYRPPANWKLRNAIEELAEWAAEVPWYMASVTRSELTKRLLALKELL